MLVGEQESGIVVKLLSQRCHTKEDMAMKQKEKPISYTNSVIAFLWGGGHIEVTIDSTVIRMATPANPTGNSGIAHESSGRNFTNAEVASSAFQQQICDQVMAAIGMTRNRQGGYGFSKAKIVSGFTLYAQSPYKILGWPHGIRKECMPCLCCGKYM